MVGVAKHEHTEPANKVFKLASAPVFLTHRHGSHGVEAIRNRGGLERSLAA
jgi:hypothetical protein